MHILDIWLKELTVFYPKNLKKILWGLPKQFSMLLKFLFIDWWWLSFFLLFSGAVANGVQGITNSPEIIYIMKLLLFAAQVYFAFLATLCAFPTSAYKSPEYIQSRQSLFWPIATPFILWIYFNWHIYRFLYLSIGFASLYKVITVTSYALLIQISWFTSPFFVFFAFIVMSTFVMHGVWYVLEHAAQLLWYTYPLCVVMFGILYGCDQLFAYVFNFLNLRMVIDPLALLVPLAVILYGTVYQWHMQLEREWQ